MCKTFLREREADFLFCQYRFKTVWMCTTVRDTLPNLLSILFYKRTGCPCETVTRSAFESNTASLSRNTPVQGVPDEWLAIKDTQREASSRMHLSRVLATVHDETLYATPAKSGIKNLN